MTTPAQRVAAALDERDALVDQEVGLIRGALSELSGDLRAVAADGRATRARVVRVETMVEAIARHLGVEIPPEVQE